MRPSPKYDPQREEAYAWENKFLAIKASPVDELRFRRVMRDICERYKVPVPKLKTIRSKKYAAFCDIENDRLEFVPQYRSIMILCHELAHWIVYHYGYKHVYHGPRWLGVYLYLLDATYTLPLDASLPSVRKAKLKFRNPCRESSPSTLKHFPATGGR